MWLPAILVIQGFASIVLILRLRDRPLRSHSAAALATEYRSAMFTGIGLAESAVLVAFIMVFIANSLWPYLVGLAFSLMGLALVAPTARDIKRRQEQLKTADAQISLLQALDTPTLGRPV